MGWSIVRLGLVLCLFSISVFAGGFWSHSPKSYGYEAINEYGEPEEETERKQVVSEYYQYKTGPQHIKGLLENTLPSLPSDMSKLDGVMEEIAGLLFHSTPLSSPASQDPEFYALKDLKPGKLNKEQAYGFRPATKDDEDTLGIMAFLAGYYGAYLKDLYRDKIVDAHLLIDKLHLNECNTEVVGDYDVYLSSVANLLRMVEVGLGKTLDWYGTLYAGHVTNPEILNMYSEAATEGGLHYGKTLVAANTANFLRNFEAVSREVGERVNVHNKKALIESKAAKNVDKVSTLSSSYDALTQYLTKFTKLIEVDPDAQITYKTIVERVKAPSSIAECQYFLESMRLSVIGLERQTIHLNKKSKNEQFQNPWEADKQLLEKIDEALKKLYKFVRLPKAVEDIVDKIRDGGGEIKHYITRDDVMNNILYLTRHHGNLKTGLEAVPDFVEKLIVHYKRIIKAVQNPLRLRYRLYSKVLCGVDTNTEYETKKQYLRFKFVFAPDKTIFILPMFIYNMSFKEVDLTNAWLPEPKNGVQGKDIQNLTLERWDTNEGTSTQINKLPNCWPALANLSDIYINCSYRPFNKALYVAKKLPNYFNKLTNLKELWIIRLGLEKIPECFQYMKNLHTVNACGNPFLDKIEGDIKTALKLPKDCKVYHKDT